MFGFILAEGEGVELCLMGENSDKRSPVLAHGALKNNSCLCCQGATVPFR